MPPASGFWLMHVQRYKVSKTQLPGIEGRIDWG
jgi:hypothetical protein